MITDDYWKFICFLSKIKLQYNYYTIENEERNERNRTKKYKTGN